MGNGVLADFARGRRTRTGIAWLAAMLTIGIGSASTPQPAAAIEPPECVEVTEYVDGGFIEPEDVFFDKTLDVVYDGVGPATLASSCEGDTMYVNDGLTVGNLTNAEELEHDFSEGCGPIEHINLDITSLLEVGKNRLRFVAYDLCGGGASMGHTYILGVTHGPPSISIASPAGAAIYTQGQAVTAIYSCTPPEGAVLESCSGPVPNGAPIDTAALGPHAFTVNAKDTDGETASESVNYTVVAPLGPFVAKKSPGAYKKCVKKAKKAHRKALARAKLLQRKARKATKGKVKRKIGKRVRRLRKRAAKRRQAQIKVCRAKYL
jgi:hypothetical protein